MEQKRIYLQGAIRRRPDRTGGFADFEREMDIRKLMEWIENLTGCESGYPDIIGSSVGEGILMVLKSWINNCFWKTIIEFGFYCRMVNIEF
jgi:hypothetical protein